MNGTAQHVSNASRREPALFLAANTVTAVVPQAV